MRVNSCHTPTDKRTRISSTRNGRPTMRCTVRPYHAVSRSKPRLNQRAGAKPASPSCGRSMVAVCAGVRISAAASDRPMAEMIVTENWR